MSADSTPILELARQAVALARRKGAQQAAASASRATDVEVGWRDGKLEKIAEASTRALSLQLYVDGRYATATTSDLRPEAIDRLVENTVAVARALTEDPFRALPDPELYQGQESIDLELVERGRPPLTPVDRRRTAQALETAVRAVKGAEKFNSVSTAWSDSRSEGVRVHSNGFEGQREDSVFSLSAEASITDVDGRRPADGSWGVARFRDELPSVEDVGRLAAQRTLARLGAKKVASGVFPMVVENRVGSTLVRQLLQPLSANALQQKRSFLDGRLGQALGSARLNLTDDPFVKRGLGSRLFDSEGIAARRHSVFSEGVLRSYYIDTYYGRKLGQKPTTASPSNLIWKPGTADLEEIIKSLDDAILVTGFLGGNSNSTTGDFSVGVQGFRIRKGQRAEPIAEMNVAGNHLEFWKRLAAVGTDAYPYSSMRTPTLLFEGVMFAGA